MSQKLPDVNKMHAENDAKEAKAKEEETAKEKRKQDEWRRAQQESEAQQAAFFERIQAVLPKLIDAAHAAGCKAVAVAKCRAHIMGVGGCENEGGQQAKKLTETYTAQGYKAFSHPIDAKQPLPAGAPVTIQPGRAVPDEMNLTVFVPKDLLVGPEHGKITSSSELVVLHWPRH